MPSKGKKRNGNPTWLPNYNAKTTRKGKNHRNYTKKHKNYSKNRKIYVKKLYIHKQYQLTNASKKERYMAKIQSERKGVASNAQKRERVPQPSKP
jgi:hypothetical protein